MLGMKDVLPVEFEIEQIGICHAIVCMCMCELHEIWAYPWHMRPREEWPMMVQGVTGIEWDVKELWKEIEKRVNLYGLSVWKQRMGRKNSLRLY
jgi:hypothetical protein